MSTQAQIDANRRNAQLSTGPRTDEGKAKVAMNAFRHGLRAEKMILPYEDPAEFEAVHAELIAEWSPESTSESDLVERMAIAKWKVMRCELTQAEYAENGSFEAPDIQDRLQQHQERLDRAYDRAMNQLMRLKKFRAQEKAQQVKSEPKPVETEDAVPDAPRPKPPQSQYVMSAAAAQPSSVAVVVPDSPVPLAG